MAIVRKIVMNSSFLLISNAINRLFDFGIIMLLSRYLGPDMFGVYEFIFIYISFWSLLVDVNTQSILIRKISREEEDTQKLMNNGITLSLTFTLIISLFACPLFFTTDYSNDIKTLIFVAIFSLVVSSNLKSVRQIIEAIFYAKMRVKYVAVCSVLDKFLFLGSVLVIYLAKGNIFHIVAVRIISAVPGFLIIIFYYLKSYGPIRISYDKSIWKNLIFDAFPLFFSNMFLMIKLQIDSVIIKGYINDNMLGIYRVATKIPFSLEIIPSAIVTVIYPLLSNYYINSQKQYYKLYRKTVQYLIILIIPLCAFVIPYASKIISLFGQEYISGGTIILQIVIFAEIFNFITLVLNHTYVASNNQKYVFVVLGFTSLFNLILNFIFTPRYGIIAAAVIVVASNIFYLILGLFLKKVRKLHFMGFSIIIRPVISGSIIVLTILYFNFSIILGAIAIAVIYPILILLTRGITREDFNYLKEILNKT